MDNSTVFIYCFAIFKAYSINEGKSSQKDYCYYSGYPMTPVKYLKRIISWEFYGLLNLVTSCLINKKKDS